MLRFTLALVLILLMFAACARSTGPLLPDESLHDACDQQALCDGSATGGTQVWGAVEISWNPMADEFHVTSRQVEIESRHYKVWGFLTPPNCEDCIAVEKTGGDSELGTAIFDITLTNPTRFQGYDVRGVLQMRDGTDLRMLNPDGYTNLFTIPGYQSPSPFIVFGWSMPDHSFSAGASLTETFEIKTDGDHFPVTFKCLVAAGYPSPPGDVSRICDFYQSGQLLSGGGSASIRFKVYDLQDDITGVCLHADALGTGDVWLTESGDEWIANLVNNVATPGIYELKVDAYSPNPQNAVTSGYYRAVVFHRESSFRSQLLSLVNADRASHGLGGLSIDPALNTVAQAHAQDMSDKQYFNHINLDGWTPWRRMDYYGVGYNSAGENIAVGHDTPGEVEAAWMDSPGHRANILNDSFGKIGIGIVPAEPGDPYSPGYYWVQLFTN